MARLEPGDPLPTLVTDRLTLRPFRRPDAEEVQRLAGAREVASTTLTIPHPYPDGAARTWIASHRSDWDAGEAVIFAIATDDEGLVGAVGMFLTLEHRRAELGYWIGEPYWGCGYATEAAGAMLDFAFDRLGLHRVEAQYLVRNPASRRVLEKIGMRHEGTRREHIIKWGVAEDIGLCAILATDERSPLARPTSPRKPRTGPPRSSSSSG